MSASNIIYPLSVTGINPTWQETLIKGSQFSQDNTVDLNGHNFNINSGIRSFLVLEGATGSETAAIQAQNGIGSTLFEGYANTSDGYHFYLRTSNGGPFVGLEGDADAGTIEYTAANGHTFTGNVGIGVNPTILFQVHYGINEWLGFDNIAGEENISITVFGTDIPGSFSALNLYSANSQGYKADLQAYDGTNLVTLILNASTQTISLTAANGFIVNGATGATEDVVIGGTTLHFSSGIYTGHS